MSSSIDHHWLDLSTEAAYQEMPPSHPSQYADRVIRKIREWEYWEGEDPEQYRGYIEQRVCSRMQQERD